MEDMENYGYTLFRTIPAFAVRNVFCFSSVVNACSSGGDRLFLIKMLVRLVATACLKTILSH